MDLRAALGAVLTGRVGVIGVGNPDLGDDGAGVRLAEVLAARRVPGVVVGERTPERWMGALAACDTVLFLDAVEAGQAPGDVLLLDAGEIESRFPQVSTHRISLGTLACLLGAGGTRAWLLGIQPASLAPGAGLSPAVTTTVGALADVLVPLLAVPAVSPAPGSRALTPVTCGEHS